MSFACNSLPQPNSATSSVHTPSPPMTPGSNSGASSSNVYDNYTGFSAWGHNVASNSYNQNYSPYYGNVDYFPPPSSMAHHHQMSAAAASTSGHHLNHYTSQHHAYSQMAYPSMAVSTHQTFNGACHNDCSIDYQIV